MITVNSIAHAAFETSDLERKIDHFTNVLGLKVVSRDKDTCYLTCPLDERSIVLNASSRSRCSQLGFYIPADAELADFAKQISGHGIKADIKSDAMPGVPRLLSFEDTNGTRINVFPDEKRAVPSSRPSGVSALKLGHIAFIAPDVGSVVDFYCKVLGFKFSDSIEDWFVWLRCNPDHHTVNFIRGNTTKMHHLAFEVKDWGQLQLACDFLSKNGFPTVWGPGRHGCGHNLFAYHRDPDGQIIELFTELDQMRDDLGCYEPRPWHRERPQKPKVWPADPAASNLWGPMPPSDFLQG